MRKTFLLILILILVGITGTIWLFAFKSPQNVPESPPATSSIQTAPDNETKQTIQKPSAPSHTATTSKPEIPSAVMEYVKNIKADPQYDWKQPINFWGRVIDESNDPVAGASVHFTWNDLSPKGTSDSDTKSDNNGFFSLTNKKGKRLYVTVSKDGYYSSGNSKGSAFEYANPADGLFTPDQFNPVVFYLRKKGVGVDLVTSQYGVSPDFRIHIPRDGTPIKVDILRRTAGDSGQMVISEIKPEFQNWKQATNWSFRIEIPNGGFVEENDEFPFEAPDTGYQSVQEFDFQQGQPDWTTDIDKDYYIKFGNPPLYGWLHIQTGISYGGAILKYAINPDGSRNLEPK